MPRLTRIPLHTALQLDAAASGVMGAVLAAAAGSLAGPLGLPEPLLRGAGLLLLPFAALVAAAGTRRTVPRDAAVGVVVANAGWVGASVLLLAGLVGGPARPTGLGYAAVAVQALAVLAFAELQWAALRRTAPAVERAGVVA